MFTASSFAQLFDYQGHLFQGPLTHNNVSADQLTHFQQAKSAIMALSPQEGFDPLGGEYWLLIENVPQDVAHIQITGSWFDVFSIYVYENNQLTFFDEDGPQIKYEKGYSSGLTMVSLGKVASDYESPIQLILRVNAPYYASPPKVWLLDSDEKSSNEIIHITAINILTGMLLSLMLYNLFLYFTAHQPVFMRYSLLMFFVTLSMPMYMQVYPSLLKFDVLYLSQPSLSFSILLLHLVASLWFARGFLKLDEQPDVYSKLNSAAIVITLLFAIVVMLMPVAPAFFIGNLFGVPILLLNIACGVNRYRNGMPQALVYVIAFSSIPITFIGVRLAYMGLIGINIDDTLLIYGSYAVEGVLLSIAVGSLYRHQHEEIRVARINAHTDSLCNLYNRRAFMDNLWHNQLPINKKQRYIMVIADIDNLKGNNDKLGHDSGDQLIIYTAQRLKEALDESMVFRLGGDEFALIYRTPHVGFDAEVRDLHLRFEQLHQQVKDKWPTSGISYGVSVFNNEDDLPAAVRKADANMYNMKASKAEH